MAKYTKQDIRIYRTLIRKGNSTDIFTSAELRDELGFAENGAESQRLHNLIQSLKKQALLKTVDDGRKRHQHLRVDASDVPALQKLLERSRRRAQDGTPSANGQVKSSRRSDAGSAPKRVLYLEDRVEALEEKIDRVESIGSSVSTLATDVQGMKAQLEELIAMWS